MPAKKKAAKPPVKLFAVSKTLAIVVAAKNAKDALQQFSELDGYDTEETAEACKTVKFEVLNEIKSLTDLPSKKWKDAQPFGEDAPKETDDEGNEPQYADVLTCGDILNPKKKKGKK